MGAYSSTWGAWECAWERMGKLLKDEKEARGVVVGMRRKHSQ